MAYAMTGENLFQSLYQNLCQMSDIERMNFYVLFISKVFQFNQSEKDMTHEELFGHLATDSFTAQEAAEYLEISLSTFRRLVAAGKLNPSATIGRSQMFSVPALKALKKARG